MVQDTSIRAYLEISDLGKRQKAVFEALQRMGHATNTMIAKELNLPINSITPRVFELRERNMVEGHYKAKCPLTGRTAIYWRIK